jgi:tRNA1(Val) A37 N6-methylase TrmN6
MNETTDGTLLGGRVRYRQFAKGHRSGFEPVLLAAAVPAKPGDHVLEAGCGAGAALLCLAHRVPGITGIGAEIDAALVGLANENFKNNDLQNIYAEKSDVSALSHGPFFDHVMANPPWHDAAGTNSPDLGRALAHHAEPDALTAWIAALGACLKPRGTITLILPAAAFAQAATCLRAQSCGGISLLPLWPRAEQPAKQIIISARRGRKSPNKILPGLVLHDDSGITPAADAILRDGASMTCI